MPANLLPRFIRCVGFIVTLGATAPALAQETALTHTSLVYAADRATERDLRQPSLQSDAVLRWTGAAGNWWGGPGAVWCAALLWLGGRATRRREVAQLGLRCVEAITIASSISGITKGLAGRARPFVAPGEPWHWHFAHGWVDARYFSMPSGHTTAAFAFAAAASIVAARWAPASRTALTVGAFAAALVVGFARIYTNQHWLSDVAMGAMLGSVTGLAIALWHGRHLNTAFDRVLLGGPAAEES